MRIVGIILAVIGVLLLFAFVYSKIRCRTGVEATISKIIEKKTVFRGSTIKEFTPVFTYTVNQKKYTQKADLVTRNAKKYAVGQKCIVLVDMEHPEKMRFGSNIGIFFCGLCLSVLGIFIVYVSFL